MIFCTLAACKFVFGPDPSLPYSNGHDGKGPALAVFGDSLSTGVLAETQFGIPIPADIVTVLNKMIFSNKFTMKAYQDQFSNYRYSAMTTDLDWGVRGHIAKKHSLDIKDVPVFLFSKWGGRTDHLDEFLADVHRLYKKRKPSEYVLIEIGGNDFCKKKTPDEFAKDYKVFFKKVLSLHPDSEILVADIPLITDTIKYKHSYSSVFSCEVFRKKLCQRVFYKDAASVLKQFNVKIKDIVSEEMKKNSKIKFTKNLSQMTLQKNHLSADCFHPSVDAHKQFSLHFKEWFTR